MFFDLTTRWRIDAPRERVFDEIAHPERWPQWWPGVASTREDDPGDADGVGRSGEIVWRAPVGYKVRFQITAERIESPGQLTASATGDLTGHGTWIFREVAGATEVAFEWRVRAGKPWMRAIAPIARRFLVDQHDRLMRAGEAALSEHLSRRDIDP